MKVTKPIEIRIVFDPNKRSPALPEIKNFADLRSELYAEFKRALRDVREDLMSNGA